MLTTVAAARRPPIDPTKKGNVMLRTGAFLLSLSITVAATACGGEEPAEMFTLTDIGGQPLPVTYPEEAGCQEELLSATLSLEADGEWDMNMTKREICGDAVEEDEDEEEGSYTVNGSSYAFESPQVSAGGNNAGEIEIEQMQQGTLEGDVLTVQLRDGTVLRFQRS